MDPAAVGADGAAGGPAIAGSVRQQALEAGLAGLGGIAALLPLAPCYLRQVSGTALSGGIG